MNINDEFQSKYLAAVEIGELKPIVEIESIDVAEFGDAGEKRKKIVLSFAGKEKLMVCNKTNRNTLVTLFGPETDDWIGKKIKLFTDEVAFKGKMTLALRISSIRVPQNSSAAPKPAAVTANEPLENDDIPF